MKPWEFDQNSRNLVSFSYILWKKGEMYNSTVQKENYWEHQLSKSDLVGTKVFWQMCVHLYFHRYSGVLRGDFTEHTEELWSKAWRSQPHGGQVGKGCFCPKLWAGKFCLPSGKGEYLRYCPLKEKQTKGICCLISFNRSKTCVEVDTLLTNTTKTDSYGKSDL